MTTAELKAQEADIREKRKALQVIWGGIFAIATFVYLMGYQALPIVGIWCYIVWWALIRDDRIRPKRVVVRPPNPMYTKLVFNLAFVIILVGIVLSGTPLLFKVITGLAYAGLTAFLAVGFGEQEAVTFGVVKNQEEVTGMIVRGGPYWRPPGWTEIESVGYRPWTATHKIKKTISDKYGVEGEVSIRFIPDFTVAYEDGPHEGENVYYHQGSPTQQPEESVIEGMTQAMVADVEATFGVLKHTDIISKGAAIILEQECRYSLKIEALPHYNPEVLRPILEPGEVLWTPPRSWRPGQPIPENLRVHFYLKNRPVIIRYMKQVKDQSEGRFEEDFGVQVQQVTVTFDFDEKSAETIAGARNTTQFRKLKKENPGITNKEILALMAGQGAEVSERTIKFEGIPAGANTIVLGDPRTGDNH